MLTEAGSSFESKLPGWSLDKVYNVTGWFTLVTPKSLLATGGFSSLAGSNTVIVKVSVLQPETTPGGQTGTSYT